MMTKAFAVKVTMPPSLMDALDVAEKLCSAVPKDELIGVHQRLDGTYLLFESNSLGQKWASKLRKQGMMATLVNRPCYYDSSEAKTPDFVPEWLKKDFDDYHNLKSAKSQVDQIEKEKAELKRQLGEAFAKRRELERTIMAKTRQVSDILMAKENALIEKNNYIKQLERKLAERESEIRELKKERGTDVD